MVTEETVEEVVQKVLQEKENILKLSEYGVKNFPLRKIVDMDERTIEFVLGQKDVLISQPAEEVAEVISQLIKKTA